MKPVSKHAATVRLMESLLVLIPLSVLMLFWASDLGWSGALGLVVVAVLFGLTTLFWRVWQRHLGYQVGDGFVTLSSGALVRRVRRMPIASVRSVALWQTPPERLFGVCGLCVTASGERLVIPCLPEREARALFDELGRMLLADWEGGS